MLDQPNPHVPSEQQDLVRQYANRLREAACGRSRPGAGSGRRCYELLNELHYELVYSDRTRRGPESKAPPA